MAVDSFLAFKRLMVKRNNELNKQAVELYEKMAAKNSATATEGATSTSATGMPADQPAAATSGENLTEEEKKKQAAELREVMRVAHSLERAEEEEMMKRAMEESEKLKTEEQKQLEEEEAMIKQAIEMSEREEKERLAKLNA